MEAEPGVTTPESYLGSERAGNFTNGLIKPGTHDYKLEKPGPKANSPTAANGRSKNSR